MLSALLLAQPKLQAQAPYFTSGHRGAHAIGVVNIAEKRLEEAVVTFYHNKHAVSTPVTTVAGYRAEALDMLCASCSSVTPTVEKHLVLVPARSLSWFEQAWNASRLGKYMAMKRQLTAPEVAALLGDKLGMVELSKSVKPFLFHLRYPT